MEYSQKKLLKEMSVGNFPSEHTVPTHIETVISNVYLFPEKVYKVYKNNSAFFNTGYRDISTKKARFEFTQKDFEWNTTLSPSIYLHTVGVRVRGDTVELCNSEDAEDLLFVMKRVDTRDILYERLLRGEISGEDAHAIGKQFGDSIQKVQKAISGNYFDLFLARIDDLEEWLKSSADAISLEESSMWCDNLRTFVNEHRTIFESKLSQEMTRDGDVHSHNAVYSHGQFYLLDSFAPKEEWARGHPYIPLYRLGSDIYALTGSVELFECFLKGYGESRGQVDRLMEHFYIVYASAIMVSYQYMLAKNDAKHAKAAKTYHSFLQNFFEKH